MARKRAEFPKIQYVNDPELLSELEEYRQQNARLMEQYTALIKRIEEQEIGSFEDLAKYDEKSAQALIKLVTGTPPILMEGRHFGFFGVTSTGKSSMINKLLGKDVAATGVGETTKEVAGYSGFNYTLYDIPGRNDDVSYFSMNYVAFCKGLTRRLVLIHHTVKEITKVFHLLDVIGLHYDIMHDSNLKRIISIFRMRFNEKNVPNSNL